MFDIVVKEVARLAPTYVVTERNGTPLVQDPAHPDGMVAVLISSLESAQAADLPTLVKNRVHNALMCLRNGNAQHG